MDEAAQKSVYDPIDDFNFEEEGERKILVPAPPETEFDNRLYFLLAHAVPRWFHGKLSREDAEARLAGKPPGSYLLRESARQAGDYTISFASRSSLKHFKVPCRPCHEKQTQSSIQNNYQDLFL